MARFEDEVETTAPGGVRVEYVDRPVPGVMISPKEAKPKKVKCAQCPQLMKDLKAAEDDVARHNKRHVAMTKALGQAEAAVGAEAEKTKKARAAVGMFQIPRLKSLLGDAGLGERTIKKVVKLAEKKNGSKR